MGWNRPLKFYQKNQAQELTGHTRLGTKCNTHLAVVIMTLQVCHLTKVYRKQRAPNCPTSSVKLLCTCMDLLSIHLPFIPLDPIIALASRASASLHFWSSILTPNLDSGSSSSYHLSQRAPARVHLNCQRLFFFFDFYQLLPLRSLWNAMASLIPL